MMKYMVCQVVMSNVENIKWRNVKEESTILYRVVSLF